MRSTLCLHDPPLQAGACAQRSDLLVCPPCLFEAPTASEALASPEWKVRMPPPACAAAPHCEVLTCSSWQKALL